MPCSSSLTSVREKDGAEDEDVDDEEEDDEAAAAEDTINNYYNQGRRRAHTMQMKRHSAEMKESVPSSSSSFHRHLLPRQLPRLHQ